MGLLGSILGFLLKVILISAVILTAGLVVPLYFLKRDVDEIKQFTQDLKNDINTRDA